MLYAERNGKRKCVIFETRARARERVRHTEDRERASTFGYKRADTLAADLNADACAPRAR